MDTVERKKLSYRIQVYLEEITHNASFFYYNSDFVLVANAVPEAFMQRLAEGTVAQSGKTNAGIVTLCGDWQSAHGYFTDVSQLLSGQSSSQNRYEREVLCSAI